MTSVLAMSDCKIPGENVLPGVEGLEGATVVLEPGAPHYGIGWGAIGAADNTMTPR